MYNFNSEQINALLAKIENPAMRNLFEMMMNQNNQTQGEFVQPNKQKYPGITREKAINDVKLCLDKIKNLKDDVMQLHNQVNELLNFQKTLTGALGACHCMGENPNCETCYGKGTPGNHIVNEAAFQKYVYPLIQKLTANVEKESQPESKNSINHISIKHKAHKNGTNGKTNNENS